jgi:hypothetical protein
MLDATVVGNRALSAHLVQAEKWLKDVVARLNFAGEFNRFLHDTPGQIG